MTFFDMAVTVQPPTGYAEPYPVLLGANRQPNDVRLMFASASGNHDAGTICTMMQMHSNPPAGFSSAYALNPDWETHCVSFERVNAGSVDRTVSWTKPNNWRHFALGTLTARGVSPSANPTGGSLWLTSESGSGSATIKSVTVPAAGAMLFFLATMADPGSGASIWPSWSVPMGIPTGWTQLVATDKSGLNFYQYDTNPHALIISRRFPAAGTTGDLILPIGKGSPAFAGLWCFLQEAEDVSINVGAA